MKHIRQKGTTPYTVVIASGILENHIAITDFPDLFEISEDAIPENAQYLNPVFKTKLETETDNYIKRINDGIEQVAQFSAGLRLQKMAGVITEESHKAIDDALIPIRTEILAGQWISGKDKLIELGSSLIGEDLYDYIMSKIDAYITENY